MEGLRKTSEIGSNAKCSAGCDEGRTEDLTANNRFQSGTLSLFTESPKNLLGIHLHRHCLFMLLSKISSVCFYSRSLDYLLPGSWLPKHYWVWTPSFRVSFKSNQTLVSYSHKFHATAALECSWDSEDSFPPCSVAMLNFYMKVFACLILHYFILSGLVLVPWRPVLL